MSMSVIHVGGVELTVSLEYYRPITHLNIKYDKEKLGTVSEDSENKLNHVLNTRF